MVANDPILDLNSKMSEPGGSLASPVAYQ